VLFFDERHMNPQQRRATLDHLRGFLAMELPAHLQLMLVTHDENLAAGCQRRLLLDAGRLVADEVNT
jgi:predicted ABC-type transport system involved in lysophospholipase L1 biosynthesis ATPase subunit